MPAIDSRQAIASSDAEYLRDAPAAVRYHRATIEELVLSIDDRIYCALMGPRLCGKTLLLRYLEQRMAPLLGWTCLFIDLEKLPAPNQQSFFAGIMHQVAHQLMRLAHLDMSELPTAASSAGFRAFLVDCLAMLQHDLVIIFDPLEALPNDLVQALLTSLRAAYMAQQDQPYQLTVVVSGALSLASLTVGESSPFRGIAQRLFVDDLTPADSLSLIQEFFLESSVNATPQAVQRLLTATQGDLFLVRQLCQCCVDLVRQRRQARLHARQVNTVIDHFLQYDVNRYAPLVEAIRLVEDDPDLLDCTLKILQQGRAARASLPLPLSPDLDPLYLTGVFARDEQDFYQLQNDIYRRFFEQHFTPARVGHVLTITGRWDAAMQYLSASVDQGAELPLADLVPATINSMYAAEHLSQAVRYLRAGLSAAFGVQEAQIWFHDPPELALRLVTPPEMDYNSFDHPVEPQMSQNADRLEARAYRQGISLRGQEDERGVVRAIPLLVAGRKAVGVVTLIEPPAWHAQDWVHEPEVAANHFDLEDEVDLKLRDELDRLRDRDQQMVAFLGQAARALQAVHTRRRELEMAGKMQASLLPELPDLPGWQLAARWQPARETAGDFYDCFSLPGEKLGLVIADVVDKGMGAALLMTLTRTLLRTYAPEYASQPSELLRIVNHRLVNDLNSGQFVTLFYAVLDLASGDLQYCNAGHPPPYHISADIAQPLTRTGMALGVREEESWQCATCRLAPGDSLVMYTDGVVEMHNAQGEQFGVQRLVESARCEADCTARQMLDLLLVETLSFAGNQPQEDDITLLVVKHAS